MVSRSSLFLILLLYLFAAACSDSSSANKPAHAIPVKAFTVTSGDQPLVNQFTGQSAGFREIQVRAQVSGILLKRYYQEGDKVTQGQSLFLIDPAPYQADLSRAEGALAQAKAALKNAQLEYNRVEPLYRQNAVSQKVRDEALASLETAKADVQAAEAEVRIAKINLGYTKVYAPITGISSKEALSEGSLITAGDPNSSLLTTITQYDPIYVNFSPPNSAVFNFHQLSHLGKLIMPEGGMTVSIHMPNGKEYEQRGRVDFMDSMVDPNTGTVRMRAIFPNPHNLIYPGQYVKLVLSGSYLKQVIAIPHRAILQTQQGPMVWVIGQDNKVSLAKVKLGMGLQNNVVVESGLEHGQAIVLEGINKMTPGALVTILPDQPPAGGNEASPNQATTKP